MTLQQYSNPDYSKESLYDLIGGEAGLLKMIKVFYDVVETDPVGQKLLLLHLRGHGVAHSRMEQFNFLSGFLGGPKLYIEKQGHSNIRKIHEHLEIDCDLKDIWLKCMSIAIDETGLTVNTKNKLMNNFTVVAERLVNNGKIN